jgi:hypothetical protein
VRINGSLVAIATTAAVSPISIGVISAKNERPSIATDLGDFRFDA